MLLNLTEKKALIIGVANQKSIAWSIAKQLHQAGATLGFTYLPDPTGKGRFKPKIEAALATIPYDFLVPCNVADDSLIASTFETVKEKWGQLDILIHSLAFSTKEGISGDFSNASRECFSQSLDISSYSLVALAKAAKLLMPKGGSIITISYLRAISLPLNQHLQQHTQNNSSIAILLLIYGIYQLNDVSTNNLTCLFFLISCLLV